MGCFVVTEFLLTTASRGPSAIAEPLVRIEFNRKKKGLANTSWASQAYTMRQIPIPMFTHPFRKSCWCCMFLARDVIYKSRAYAMMPVRLSVHLSVTEVHWRIIAALLTDCFYFCQANKFIHSFIHSFCHLCQTFISNISSTGHNVMLYNYCYS